MQLQDITPKQKQIVLFAVAFLKSNLDEEIVEASNLPITEMALEGLEDDLKEIWNMI